MWELRPSSQPASNMNTNESLRRIGALLLPLPSRLEGTSGHFACIAGEPGLNFRPSESFELLVHLVAFSYVSPRTLAESSPRRYDLSYSFREESWKTSRTIATAQVSNLPSNISERYPLIFHGHSAAAIRIRRCCQLNEERCKVFS